ncbi:MAG: radical SAM protein [Candidatus Abyssobacteria bacterium SURF_17]|uniref:Radical SAM protein n=1 Tax=Candidatus Abyssobacteria bacterium SURF_17 TaxID=2093361 RepID=A0A419F2Y4_9BACT|nr:MAG: radical SAM protein [Candidatus Abyssubacteria bacterium SURF_17]
MKILLISANTERINMPTIPLGLGCIAAAVQQAGHEILLLDLLGVTDTRSAIAKAVTDFHPHVIGISVRNIDDQKMADTKFLLDQVRAIVSQCKSVSDVPVVLGGAGYSVSPAAALEYLQADMGIQGEGEAAFVALLERLQENANLAGTPSLYLPGKGLQGERSFVADLDTFPLPDPSLWPGSYANEPQLWMPIQTRRGCAMDCSYCSTATIEGKVLRKRSVETVIRSVARHVEAGFKRFYFTDNTFNLPPSYARELCRHLTAAKLDISWRCIVYPVKLDESLVIDMAESGCKEVSLGFESGNPEILRNFNKRFKPDDIRHTSDLMAKYGMKRMGFLLLGGPGETKETVEESIAFADSLKLDMVKLNVGIRIYPNTALARIAADEGIIERDDPLLFPKFYVVADLKDFLYETVNHWLSLRPNWTT